MRFNGSVSGSLVGYSIVRLSPLDLLLAAGMSVFFGLLWIGMELLEGQSLRAAYRDVAPDLVGYTLMLIGLYAAKNWWDDHRDPY